MHKINRFNESVLIEDGYPVIRVKDIIEYLQKLSPEMRVELDKDGWGSWPLKGYDDKSAIDVIEDRGIFDVWTPPDGETYLTINN